jgi:DNA helicase-2/ATP-dependent DNA helicase PcrA
LRGDASSVPQVREVTNAGLKDYADGLLEWSARGEDRLAYVAASRARELLLGSASWWRAGRRTRLGPSDVFEALAGCAADQGYDVVRAEDPGPEASNPLAADPGWVSWQDPPEDAELLAWAAQEVLEPVTPLTRQASELTPEDESSMWSLDEQTRLLVAQELERRRRPRVPVPRSLSVSQLVRSGTDPTGLADDLARPMPRRVNLQAGLGTMFHDWVRCRFDLPVALDDGGTPFDADDVDGALVDLPSCRDDALSALRSRFLEGPYAARVPVAVEAPYVMSLAGRELRGRIDAVYPGEAPYRFQVVDWKTSSRENADPLQLAVYRLAWAIAHGCPVDEVDAVFYYVRRGTVIRPEQLPGQEEVESLLTRLGSDGLVRQPG